MTKEQAERMIGVLKRVQAGEHDLSPQEARELIETLGEYCETAGGGKKDFLRLVSEFVAPSIPPNVWDPFMQRVDLVWDMATDKGNN
jgi:hypothetical protein